MMLENQLKPREREKASKKARKRDHASETAEQREERLNR